MHPSRSFQKFADRDFVPQQFVAPSANRPPRLRQQFAKLFGQSFQLDALHDLIHSQNEITVQDIQKKVADYYKIRVADMHSKRRPRVIAYPRQIAMYLSKKLTQKSYPEIGELFGGKDHTTVLHACKKVAELRGQDASMAEDYTILVRTLST